MIFQSFSFCCQQCHPHLSSGHWLESTWVLNVACKWLLKKWGGQFSDRQRQKIGGKMNWQLRMNRIVKDSFFSRFGIIKNILTHDEDHPNPIPTGSRSSPTPKPQASSTVAIEISYQNLTSTDDVIIASAGRGDVHRQNRSYDNLGARVRVPHLLLPCGDWVGCLSGRCCLLPLSDILPRLLGPMLLWGSEKAHSETADHLIKVCFDKRAETQ